MTASQKSEQLEDRLIEFAIRIVRMLQHLPKDFIGAHFGKQVLRSGSAPALIYGEMRSAESDADFRHKASLIQKELRETFNNLRIVRGLNLTPVEKMNPIVGESEELLKIFVAIVKSVDERITRNGGKKGKK